MKRKTLTMALAGLAMCAPVQAYDVTDRFSIGGVLSGAMQCQYLQDDAGADDQCNGAMPLQPEASFRPTANDEFFVKFGFAAGNGLNSNENRNRSPFVLETWAADLEDDVEDINGRNRDYLLTGWYKHTFQFQDIGSLGVTFGLIDSTDYLDENAYANDEYTQFMNEVFANDSEQNLPSYDAGGVFEWKSGRWSAQAVGMNIGKNDDDNEYNFFGAELGYTAQTVWGEGNYRVTVTGTNEQFLDPAGENDESLLSAGLSFDQQVGDNWGAFLRFSWQDDDAAVDYDALYTGGVDVSGKLWSRAEDNIGVGLAYLAGGNLDIDETYVFESYYRATFGDYFAMTADIQWMKDDLKGPGNENAKGWIFSLRATAEF